MGENYLVSVMSVSEDLLCFLRSVMCGSEWRAMASRGAVEQAARARMPMVVTAHRLLGELIRWNDNSQNQYRPSFSYSTVHRMKHN
jgi:hypothetical protein